jgi:6-phosphofructokinase
MGKVKTVGVVNGGGDAPGLNAVIRAVVRSAIGAHGMRVIGIHNGLDGLIWPEGAVSFEEAFSQLKVVDPASEIVHAARAIGTTFGDCT